MAFDVFISHSSKDKVTADAVCAILESECIRCWVAPRDIGPGEDWGQAIIAAIKGARVMVLILSANANESPQIKREVERAVSLNIPILPLRIENVLPSASLEYFISTQHWLDAFTPPLDRHLRYLVQVIQKILVGPPKKPVAIRKAPVTNETIAAVLETIPPPTVEPELPPEPEPQYIPPPKSSGTPAWLIGTLIGLLVAAAAIGGWWFATRQRSVSPPQTVKTSTPENEPALEDGFVSMFNGRDLTGWKDQFNDWSVQDGLLTLGPTSDWGNLWWTNGPVHNFELRFSCRFVGLVEKYRGILSVSYRGATRPDATLQKDQSCFTEISANPNTACSIFQKVVDGSKFVYPMLAKPSQRRVMRPGEPRTMKAIESEVTPLALVNSSFRQDWNDVDILAQGPHIVVTINGIVTAELFDEDPENRSAGGEFGLSGHRDLGKLIYGQFKDIRLKKLTDDGTGEAPPPTIVPAKSPSTPPPSPAADAAGFISVFNGRDFTGWHLDTPNWSVQNHAMDVKGGWGGMIWLTNGGANNLEWRFRCRFVGPHPGSEIWVCFRGSGNPNPTVQSDVGFFTKLTANSGQAGALFQHDLGGSPAFPILAHPSEKRTIQPDEPRQSETIEAHVSPVSAAENAFKEDWNDVSIIANGNHITVALNGIVISELFDNDPQYAGTGGVVAFVVNKSAHVQFKDIKIKRLSGKT